MLDNRLVVSYFPPAYYKAMSGIAFRQRVQLELERQNMTKAELSRRSNVPYHAIDKLLKREGASTSTENAAAIANALGISADDDAREYEELRELFFQLDEDKQRFVLESVRGLLK